jgi:hypothetical protein
MKQSKQNAFPQLKCSAPDSLEELSLRQLRTLMFLHGLKWEDCLERADMIARIEARLFFSSFLFLPYFL